jgi:DNA-binding response OmpR family regulator
MTKEILIVDDEPNVVIPLQFLMEQHGYKVMIAEGGEDALDLVYRYKPDLVLLDIMLPGIDGYEVCEIIRLNPNFRNVKIIFLTVKGREVEIAKGMALGADAYITKPFSNAALVAGENIKPFFSEIISADIRGKLSFFCFVILTIQEVVSGVSFQVPSTN